MKIQLPKKVIYKGEKIPPNTPFCIDKKDLAPFVKQGAWVLEEEVKEEKTNGDSTTITGQSEPMSTSADRGGSKTK